MMRVGPITAISTQSKLLNQSLFIDAPHVDTHRSRPRRGRGEVSGPSKYGIRTNALPNLSLRLGRFCDRYHKTCRILTVFIGYRIYNAEVEKHGTRYDLSAHCAWN